MQEHPWQFASFWISRLRAHKCIECAMQQCLHDVIPFRTHCAVQYILCIAHSTHPNVECMEKCHRAYMVRTLSDSNGVFLNDWNFSMFFGYFSKYAIRIASPASSGFFAGMAHVDWMMAICCGVSEVIMGITIGVLWQDEITPIFFFGFLFCFLNRIKGSNRWRFVCVCVDLLLFCSLFVRY